MVRIRTTTSLIILAALALLAGSIQAASIPGSAGVITLQDGPNTEGLFFQIDVHYEAFDGLDASDPLGVTPGKLQFAYIIEYVNGNEVMNFFDLESTNGIPLAETAVSTNGTVDGITPGSIIPGGHLIWTLASGNPAARYIFLDEETEEPIFGSIGDRSVILAFTVSNEYGVGSILAQGTNHSLSDAGEVVGPATPPVQCFGTVEGYVFCGDCSSSGQVVPMEGITVKVLSDGNQAASAVTGANGQYNISGLAVGDYTVVADKGTGLTANSAESVNITASCEEPAFAAFNICPTACGQQISVSVICDQNGAPVPNAWVGISGPGIDKCHNWTRTNVDGTKVYSGEKIVPGHYKIVVKAPKGYTLSGESKVEFDLAECETKQLVFNACPIPPCTQSVCVQVVQPGDGNDMIPVPGVTVELNCDRARKGITDVSGSKCFDNVELGHHTVTVIIPEGYRLADGDKAVRFVLQRCEQKSLQFVLSPIVLAPCPQMPCYWKTHQSTWPITSMYVGADILNSQQLMNILNGKLANGARPRCNDITVELAQYLIAVKFSIANGSDTQDIDPVVIAADEFLLYDYPPGSSPTGRGKELARTLKNKLYDYLRDRNFCQE